VAGVVMDTFVFITDYPVVTLQRSAPLIPKPTTAHDPEPVLSTSHPHNQFP